MQKVICYFKNQWSLSDWSAAVLLLVVISLLWLKGYPAPHCDDLFFLGAGISLASGHGLTNPYIQPWLDFYGTQSFLLQPPGHPYLTSLWLRLFGISELSVRIFQWSALISGAYLFCRYLRLFSISRGIRLLAFLAYLLAFQRDGLRPEITAFMLMFAGIVLLPARSMPTRFVAWLILGYSALCYPITVFASPALFIGHWWFQNGSNRILWQQTVRSHILPLSAAMAATIIVFHLMIGGQWTEFARCLQISKLLATPGIGLPNLLWHWIRITMNAQILITLPLYAAALFITIISWAWRTRYDIRLRIILTTLMLCVLLTAAGSPLAALNFCKALCLIIIAIGVAGSRLLPKPTLIPAVAIMIAITHPYFLLGLPFQKIPTRNGYQEIQEFAQREISAGKRLILDETSARFVFDYRLPKDTLDATYFNTEYLYERINEPRMHGIDKSKVGRAPNQKLTYTHKPESDIWILAEARLLWGIDDFPKEGRKSRPVVTLFGKRFGTVPVEPYKIIIVE